LSKGLSSPVGSILVGRRDDIERARYLRKQLGGGMRQAGILAACGIIGLTKMLGRLNDDHANARKLAEGLKGLPGVELDMASVQTNILYFGVPGREKEFDGWMKKLADQKVLALCLGTRWRLVTHNDVDAEDVGRALKAWRDILGAA
jgi:threonine aldolase